MVREYAVIDQPPRPTSALRRWREEYNPMVSSQRMLVQTRKDSHCAKVFEKPVVGQAHMLPSTVVRTDVNNDPEALHILQLMA